MHLSTTSPVVLVHSLTFTRNLSHHTLNIYASTRPTQTASFTAKRLPNSLIVHTTTTALAHNVLSHRHPRTQVHTRAVSSPQPNLHKHPRIDRPTRVHSPLMRIYSLRSTSCKTTNLLTDISSALHHHLSPSTSAAQLDRLSCAFMLVNMSHTSPLRIYITHSPTTENTNSVLPPARSLMQ
jgi:hypothetical protein